MDEINVVLQTSLTLDQAQNKPTPKPQTSPNPNPNPTPNHLESLRLWSLIDFRNAKSKSKSQLKPKTEEVPVSIATAEEVALGWQRYLTLPGVDWRIFPGLSTLARGIRELVGTSVTLPDLCLLEQSFGPFTVAFEKIDALVFDQHGQRKRIFDKQIASVADAACALKEQVEGTYIFWIDKTDAETPGIRLSYVGNRPEAHHVKVANQGKEGFSLPGSEEMVVKADRIIALLGDKLTHPWRRQSSASAEMSIQPDLRDKGKEEKEKEICLRQSDPFVDPVVEFSDFLTREDLVRLEKNVGENATTGRLLEEKLQTGAEVFSDKQYTLAAKLFVEIIIRVAAWQKEKSYEEGVDSSPSHMIHASCFCSACTAIHYTACAYGNIGHVYFAMGELEKAVEYFEKSLPMLREIGLWKESPKVLTRLFECALRLDDSRRIRLYGLQKIGSTQRNKNRETLLQQMREASRQALDEAANLNVSSAATEFALGAEMALLRGKMVQSLSHFGRALEAARLCVPGEEARYLEAKALVYIGAVCYSMSRTCVALVHLEEALLLLRGSKTGTAEAELQKVALGSMVTICESAGWSKAAIKYRHELTVLET